MNCGRSGSARMNRFFLGRKWGNDTRRNSPRYSCPRKGIHQIEQPLKSRKDVSVNVYQFTVIIERQPEGEYLVSVPALPGCYTEGRTLEEAREMAADAIRAYCASLLKHGEPIPVESPEEQFIGRLSVSLEPA
jgi:antitoxin HicB